MYFSFEKKIDTIIVHAGGPDFAFLGAEESGANHCMEFYLFSGMEYSSFCHCRNIDAKNQYLFL